MLFRSPIDASGKVGKPFPVVQGHYKKDEAQFSYDGKWLAYTSDINEAGKFEVYVTSFPPGGDNKQISTDGGGQPRWRRDGKELFYRSGTRLMRVDIALGAKIEPGIPQQMFLSTSNNSATLDPVRHMWSALPDGQHFLTRISTGIRGAGPNAAGAGTTGAGTNLTPFYTPPGQSAGRASGPGPVVNGLTEILHWPSALGKGSK